MGNALILAVIFTMLTIYETIYYLNEGTTRFNQPLTITWSMWGIYVLSVIAFFWRRHYLQRKMSALASDALVDSMVTNHPAMYYYQLPILQMADGVKIPIAGKRPCTFEYLFHRRVHQLVTYIGILDLTSIQVRSSERTVYVHPIDLFKLRNRYEVRVDGIYYGILQSKRLLKEKGIKKMIYYTLETSEGKLSIENEHLTPIVTMTTAEGQEVFKAERNGYTWEKSAYSGKRGEQHEINIHTAIFSDEVLLAIYVFVMNQNNQ